MSVVNTETVVMMGAALAAAGNVQGQEAVRTGERTIGWNEADPTLIIGKKLNTTSLGLRKIPGDTV